MNADIIYRVSYRKKSLIASKKTPPITTNRTRPRAQRGIGDCFASFSLRDAFTGFLPARALLLNCSFLWRISREEVDMI